MNHRVRETRRSATGLVATVLAPLLVLLAIVIEFLSFHSYQLLLPESLILISAAVAFGLVFGALSCVTRLPFQPVLMSIALALFISRNSLIELFASAVPGSISGLLGTDNILMGYYVVLILLAGSVCWLIQKHLPVIVSIVFATIIGTSIVLPVESVGVEPNRASGSIQSSLPPLVHIILDGQSGLAGFPTDMPGSLQVRKMMRNTYQDFEIHERGFSLFHKTQHSIASVMNGVVTSKVTELLDQESGTNVLKRNGWFSKLKSQGYAIHVYHPGWLDMCQDRTLVSWCYKYPLDAVSAVQRSKLTTRQRLWIMAAKILDDKGSSVYQKLGLTPLPAFEVFHKFQDDIVQRGRGVAHVLHLLLPHEGFWYNADCSLRPPPENVLFIFSNKSVAPQRSQEVRVASYEKYFAQVTCTNRLIGMLLQRMKQAQLYEDARIIVHGDHGSRIIGVNVNSVAGEDLTNLDLIDIFSTHIAIKAPGVAPAIKSAPMSVQRLFAEQYFDTAPDSERPEPNAVHTIDRNGKFLTRSLVWPD